MKAPASPSVGLQPDRRPGFVAGQVAPVDNPMARQAEQLGQATEAAGQAVLRTDAILRERLARARAREADAKIADGFRELLTSPKGYRNKVGREAVDGREDVLREVDAHRRRILDTLTPKERDLIADSDDARYQQVRGAIDGHFTNQLEAYETAEVEARAGSLLNDALEGYFLPKSPLPNQRDPYKDNRTALQTELRTLAARKGLGEGATKALLTKAEEQLHSAIVTRLIDEGKAPQAAEYLATEGKNLTGTVRTTLADRVRDGGIREQGQQLASWVSRTGGSFTNQLDILDAMRDNSEDLSVEVYDEAKRRLVHDAGLRADARAAAGKQALDAAKTWVSLNGGASLPAAAREKLRETGQEAAFDLWTLQGNQFVTTNEGLLASLNTTDEKLATYRTEADVTAAFRTRLNDSHLSDLVLRYRKVKGEALSPKDAETIDKRLQEKNYLDRKGFFTAFKSDKDIGRRTDLFAEAVTMRVNELAAGKNVTAALRAQAIDDVYNNGFTLGGRWIPSVMATPEERQSPDASNTTRQGMIVTQQMMAGDPATGRVQADPTTVRLVSGEVVDLRGSPEDDLVPTRSAIIDGLTGPNGEVVLVGLRKKLGRIPTEPEIAQEFADIRSVQLQRKADAQRIASVENKLRAAALLERLGDEVESQFRADYDKMLAAFRRYDSVEVRSRRELDPYFKDPVIQALVANNGQKLRDRDLFRLSLESVLTKHASELSGYGVNWSEATAWVPSADYWLKKDDPLRTLVVRERGMVTGLGPTMAGSSERRIPIETASGPARPGYLQRIDPSPSDQEKAMLKALREKYAKTEKP